MQLRDKVALITGGGRGIGRAIALAYAKAGASVAIAARTTTEIEAVAREINECGGQAVALAADITDSGSVTAMIERAVDRWGGLQILVNNAGGGTERTRVGDDDPAAWAQVVELNLIGTYYCCRAAVPHLKVAGGTIINVGSGMGHQARAGNSSYNAAKAGVWMLTRCLALELWSHRITVNELVPGPVYTELTRDIFTLGQPHPKIESEWVKHPDEVASLALFLAAQHEHGPTGQSFSLARRPT